MSNTYAKDWPEIAARIRKRAGYRCERCGVGPGESYNRRSGKIVSTKEFERLGKEATRARLQRLKTHDDALRRTKECFLSPLITEAETSGDYDRGYFAEGGYYPFEYERDNTTTAFPHKGGYRSIYEAFGASASKSVLR